MFSICTPEDAGISSAHVARFFQILEDYRLSTHDFILAKGNKIFTECYYKPFRPEDKHRMYSVSKSFVSVAIGLLEEEGRISLDDPLAKYFPEKLNSQVHPYMKEVTIREMLTMETGILEVGMWFDFHEGDRTGVYFKSPGTKVPGTLFSYDSSGSYMLGTLVERVSGMPFMEYLKSKVLRHIGFSQDAYCLKAPGGHSWSDSAVMCTPRDLLAMARFVANRGTWDGVRYMNAAYLEAAVSKQVSNDHRGFVSRERWGYGYQIWKAPRDGFYFSGMGCQFAIFDPQTDLILVINSDNQGNPIASEVIFDAFYGEIVNHMGEPLPEAPEEQAKLQSLLDTAELAYLPQGLQTPFAEQVQDVTYRLEANPMGIRWFRLHLDGKQGSLTYCNRQGEKELLFGMGCNVFGMFPETGYSDEVGGERAPGFRYPCACSAQWSEPQKLLIKVQLLGRYYGNAGFEFGFKDRRVTLWMEKTAEDFLKEYEGMAVGQIEEA